MGLENWNMWKEMTPKEYFANDCLAFPIKVCPDRSFSHLTADQHSLDTGLSISIAFLFKK